MAKVALTKFAGEFRAMFLPQQVGCSISGGAEAVVHSARAQINSISDGTRVLLKLDFENAFNSLLRGYLLRQVRDKIPTAFRFLHQVYGSPANLMYNGSNLVNVQGVQQGDPLGPALFCVGLSALTKSLSSAYNAWYLDDGTLIDTPDVVLRDIQTIITMAGETGLNLNSSKC